MVPEHVGDKLTVGLDDLSHLSNLNDSMILSFTSMGVLFSGSDLVHMAAAAGGGQLLGLFFMERSQK